MDALYVYTDGGSRGNPGPGAIAFVIFRDGTLVKKHRECIGKTTNNRAEYRAVIKALEAAFGLANEVNCFSDSKLLVNQISGRWKVRDSGLKPLFERVKELERSFKKVSYASVRRTDERIQMADALVNEALDEECP